jgi:GDPmannose 4,6-dehydratase
MKTALITGISGQDGAYLSKLLLQKSYRVVGITRNNHLYNLSKLKYLGIDNQIIIEECELTDSISLMRILQKYQPDEIYNLAAQSSVSLSFQQPISTINYNIASVTNLLEIIRLLLPEVKFYQSSSSEMYGKVVDLPVTTSTPMHPLSPYAISKCTGYWLCVNYREAYKLFACNGVLFNHESYLRGGNFFVKKIIEEAFEIMIGKQETLQVGNIDIKRDYGFAPSYVEAMWLMLQKEEPNDYIICSGKSVSLREIIYHVFDRLNIDKSRIQIDPKLFRPSDIENMYGDNSTSLINLGWKYQFDFFQVLDIIIEEYIRNRNLK